MTRSDSCKRRSPATRSLFEKLEVRQLLAADIRSYDGTGNNLTHPDWGATTEDLLRLAPSAYGDGVLSPAGASRPSARAISNAVVAHPSDELLSSRHLAAYAYLWGQFIDHDLDLTSTTSDAMNIAVPIGDPYFDPASTGTQTIGFTRSQSNPLTGITGPRQQFNAITAYLDGSMIYGSEGTRVNKLRSLVGGQMLTSAGGLLPYNTMGIEMATLGGPDSNYFAAGDVRGNENIELTAMQTLFVREHNRIAANALLAHPTWTDEELFQYARKIVGAEVQSITYNEFLPALLGPNALQPYNGYHANVNAGIATEFSTAAFRLGHSMLANDVEFMDNNANSVRDDLELADAFFNPAVVAETGIDPILKYLASSNSEEIDNKVVDGLRNFLFGPPGAGGFDLASLNIQRGRDHGLSDYNTTRVALGLPSVSSFAQISSDPAVQAALQSAYGSVSNMDLWVAGLAENHLPGSNLGPTFQRILVDQFSRTRDGDRFWYQNDLTGADLQFVQNRRLVDIVRDNTGLTNLQQNVFVFDVQVTGRLWSDNNGNGRPDPNEPGLVGQHVRLRDSLGNLLQTATTGANGVYNFSNIQVGDYSVVPDTQNGWRYTTPQISPLDVTRGQRFDRVDFGRQLVQQQLHFDPNAHAIENPISEMFLSTTSLLA